MLRSDMMMIMAMIILLKSIYPTSVLPSVYVLNASTLSATLIQPNNFTNEKIARSSEKVINKGIGQIRHDHVNCNAMDKNDKSNRL